MKRILALALAVLLALGLTACQDEKNISGALTEVRTDENGALTALILERGGKRTGVLLAEGTSVWPRGEGSWTSEEAMEAFREDLQPGNELSAWCYSRKEKLETAEGESIPAYWGQNISITAILEREALTLRDGTPVDRLDYDSWGSYTYRLTDGTELLRVEEPRGPEDVIVMDSENFEDLSETAQGKVRAYYEAQGLLYDEQEELENAYAAYRELGEDFQAGHIRQEVTPTASSRRVMYFETGVTLPNVYGTQTYRGFSLHDAFDRETGEKLDPWALFAVPEEEVRRRLPELPGWIDNPVLRAEMAEALEPEWIGFGRDGLFIEFPAGSLPSEELAYHVGIDWQDVPEGFFQPWAVPDGRSE
ncbi:hypothetical protein [Oscillibacter sp.]|uniref:hypothetical protein n=1 Tax=Oscillibacter sp. TaxID=1945593 RepID=UPI002D80F4F3|nr:hypothetical protein [Oscillibacter sp.]